MKKLYELCVKAFYEGYEYYGETPFPFEDKDAFWIRWNPSNPKAINLDDSDMQAPSYFVASLKLYQPNRECSNVSIGIYPYDNGQRIYFYSGCRVFDIAVTPEIQQVLGQVVLKHYSFDKSNPNVNKHYREDLPF